MKYYLITLFLVFIACGITSAQKTSRKASNKQAELVQKDEQKKEVEKKQRADAAEQDRESRVEKKPQYKKAKRMRKTRMKDKGITPHPSQRPEQPPAEIRK